MKRISAIVVAYKSDDHLGACLDTLMARNDIGSELEIIVVDNEIEGADKRGHALLQKYPTGVHYIKNTKNGGYGQGNNVGIRASTSPLILVMNPDVRLDGTTPGKICRRFEEDEKLILLGMRQCLGNGNRGRSILWANALPAGLFGKMLTWGSNRCGLFFQKWQCVQGSCFAVRKDAFEAAGLFDERIFMYGEEMDIHARLAALNAGRMKVDWSMSYRHLTDEREYSLRKTIAQWESRASWCVRHGIDRSTYWGCMKRNLRQNLLWTLFKNMGRESKNSRRIREQLVALESCWADDSPHGGIEAAR